MAALQVGTMPATVGLDGDSVEWTIAGVLSASADVRSAIIS